MRLIPVLALLLAATAAWAQPQGSLQQYSPAVPSPSYGGYGYGMYGGTPGGATVEGSMMQGMASVISAQGNYNLATSAAAVNLTQAQKQDIINRQDATNAYFAMQDTNRAARAAKRAPRPNEEQLVRLAATAAPKPISTSEINPVSGQIVWPDRLRGDAFKQDRAVVDQLLARQVRYGKLGLAEHDQLGHAIERMSDTLRGQIRSLPAAEYIDSKNFLKSLMYAVTKTQLS
jgi:hypothetical protein